MFAPRDVVGQRSETVRRSNLSAIVRAVHLRGPLSRSELVAHTGLTRSAIRGLIGELVGGGVLTETPQRARRRAGPPVPARPSRHRRASVIALEINVDSLAVARVGLGGSIGELVRVDRPRAHVTLDEIVADLVELANRCLHRSATTGSSASAWPWRGSCDEATASSGWHRTWDGPTSRSATASRRRFERTRRSRSPTRRTSAGWPSIAAAPRSGRSTSSTSRARSAWAGTSPSAVGRCVGAAGYAGEVGHMVVNPAGAACACGSSGCWETEIGERAMLVRAGRAPDGGSAAVDELIEAATAGEPAARAGVAHVGTWLGVGIASLANIFDPTLVVLGGVLGRIHPLVALGARGRPRSPARCPASRELVRVIPGALGVNAPIIGAAELAFEPMLADPARRLAGARARLSAAASA